MENNEIIVRVNHLPLLMYLFLWRGPFLRRKAAGEYRLRLFPRLKIARTALYLHSPYTMVSAFLDTVTASSQK
jgi:hypothetical protein